MRPDDVESVLVCPRPEEVDVATAASPERVRRACADCGRTVLVRRRYLVLRAVAVCGDCAVSRVEQSPGAHRVGLAADAAERLTGPERN